MAEALFRLRTGPQSPWQAASAGVAALDGWPASPCAIEAIRESGGDLSSHVSHALSREIIARATWILGLTQRHVDALLLRFPEAAGKIRLLSSFGSGGASDVADPIGSDLFVYRHVRDQIDSALTDFLIYLHEKEPAFPRPAKEKTMKMAIGSDHGGFSLKQHLAQVLCERGLDVEDVGTCSTESADYPPIAADVAARVADGRAAQGLLICTSGNGVAITANKLPGVRAAICWNPELATFARKHNDANILVLGGKFVSPADAGKILAAWLDASFEGGRHERRVSQISSIAHEAPILSDLAATDPELARAVLQEGKRQRAHLELIASENYTSAAVRAAAGSLLTNKYAEGYPGKRWYSGCEFVDVAEQLAIQRAKALFGADHANVQPHCGSSANMAVYFAMLQPGDTILAMSLAEGGHLTHGHKMNFSGRFFRVIPYGVRKDTEQLDYDAMEKLAAEHKPKLICAGASAYSRVIDFPRLRAIADSVGALLMVDMAHIAGLVAGGVHPNPVPFSDFVTTTTHKTLRGPRGGLILCREKYAADIDKQVFPGIQGGPLMHVIAAKAVCLLEASQPAFKVYARQVADNAQTLAAALQSHGLRIVSGGTDNHLMLVDLTAANVSGKDAAAALDRASITVNKNAIPFDARSPFVTSGIRVGTPALTTRGMTGADMKDIAGWINAVVRAPMDEAVIQSVRSQVEARTAQFPIP